MDPITRIEIKKYIDDELVDDIIAKFNTHQMVYVVKRKRRKIFVIEDKIAGVCFTNFINYQTMNNGYFSDYSKNIYATKEEAYEYAEQLDRQSNIKFKS